MEENSILSFSFAYNDRQQSLQCKCPGLDTKLSFSAWPKHMN